MLQALLVDKGCSEEGGLSLVCSSSHTLVTGERGSASERGSPTQNLVLQLILSVGQALWFSSTGQVCLGGRAEYQDLIPLVTGAQ